MTDPATDAQESPRDFELIRIAAEFLDTERFDYATIAIQTAVEIYVEKRLSTILAWRNLGPGRCVGS